MGRVLTERRRDRGMDLKGRTISEELEDQIERRGKERGRDIGGSASAVFGTPKGGSEVTNEHDNSRKQLSCHSVNHVSP